MKGVVVSPEPPAVAVGARILEEGGNAFDAAVAGAVAEGVTNPFLCGLGGRGGFFCRAAGLEPKIIDCGGSIGSGERPKEWYDAVTTRAEPLSGYRISGDKPLRGYNQIVTPGFVKGLWTVYHKYCSGKFSWAELLEPAIRLCEEGFDVYPYIAQRWVEGEARPGAFGLAQKFEKFPEFRRVYTKNGEPYKTGDILVQPDYGRTLRWIAKDGGDVFYKGELGDVLGADLEANGSFVTREDLRNYVTYEDEPVSGWYRGYQVVSGSRCGPHVVEMLHILKHFDLSGMELNGPAYVDLVSKAMLAGFHDTTGLAGDPPHSIKKILEQRAISEERAAWWADRIKTGQKIDGPTLCPTDAGTTSICAMDEAGNIVAWTHSLGGLAGSGAVTPGLGFLLNDFMGHFNPAPNKWDSMVPGKRMHGGSQVMLFRDGRPFLALGAAGGSRQNTAILQTIVNIIDFGMSVEEAVKVPRFHHEQEEILLVEPDLPADSVAYMREKGLKVTQSYPLSRVQAAYGDPLTGKMHGGVDPRGGAAIAVQ